MDSMDSIDSTTTEENIEGKVDSEEQVVKVNTPAEEWPLGPHPLKYNWTFYFVRRQPAFSRTDNYEKNIKRIGSFGTVRYNAQMAAFRDVTTINGSGKVEEFWAFYNHLVRPSDQALICDYHLFKTGIKPMWEDCTNRKGGKFVFRIQKKKRLTSKYWEDLLLALVGDQLGEYGEEICGIVVSIRNSDDVFSVWNKTSTNIEIRNKIAQVIKQILGLPPNLTFDYKPHDQSIKDSTHFLSRNTKPGGMHAEVVDEAK